MTTELLAWYKGDGNADDSVGGKNATFDGEYETKSGSQYFKIQYGSVSHKHTVTYDSNDGTLGTPPTDSNEYDAEDTVTVLDSPVPLYRIGYSYSGKWNTKADGSGTSYSPGDEFSMGTENVKLYAQCYSFELGTGLPEPQVYSFPILAATNYHVKVDYNNGRYELYVDTVKIEPSSYQDNAILESNDGFTFGYTEYVNSVFYVKDIKINEEVVMSVTQVTVPSGLSRADERAGWEYEVSTALEAGADVQFIDHKGNECNVALVGAFAANSGNPKNGNIKRRGVNEADSLATTKFITGGIFHNMPTAYIYSSGTDTGLKLHVKLEN